VRCLMLHVVCSFQLASTYFFCKGLCSCKPIANLHLDQSKADQIFSECITLLKVQPRP